MHHRQMKHLRQIDEARDFFGRLRGPGAAVEIRIARDQRHRPAVQARKPRDHRAPPQPADFEKRFAIDQRIDDAPHLVHLARILGHGLDQPGVAAPGVVLAGRSRRQLVHRTRQVGEETPRPRERFGLACRLVVHGAVAGMDGAAAELVLLVALLHPRHHRWTRDEQLRGVFHHHRIMARRHPRRAQPRDRTQGERHHRHHRHVLHHLFPDGDGGNLRPAVLLDVLHRTAAAGAVDQAQHRQAQFAGHHLGALQLLAQAAVVGAAAHGEIVAGDHHRPAVNPAAPHDQVGRHHVDERALLVVARLAGDRADLVERTRVEQAGDALAHRQLAAVVLTLDLVRPAHSAPEFLAFAQFVDFRLPGHGILAGIDEYSRPSLPARARLPPQTERATVAPEKPA